jgi:hypothetical protein
MQVDMLLQAEQIEIAPAVPAKGDLPAIILALSPTETNHPCVPIFLRHIQGGHEQRTLATDLLVSAYRGTLQIHRLFACRYPQWRLVTRICIGMQSFLWWAYKNLKSQGGRNYN